LIVGARPGPIAHGVSLYPYSFVSSELRTMSFLLQCRVCQLILQIFEFACLRCAATSASIPARRLRPNPRAVNSCAPSSRPPACSQRGAIAANWRDISLPDRTTNMVSAQYPAGRAVDDQLAKNLLCAVMIVGCSRGEASNRLTKQFGRSRAVASVEAHGHSGFREVPIGLTGS